MTSQPNTGPSDKHPTIRDTLIVQIKFISVDHEGVVRVANQASQVDRSERHEWNCLRLEQEAHRLAVVMVAGLESGGWKKRGGLRRGPPIGPERQIGEGDGEPTSGEGSPL